MQKLARTDKYKPLEKDIEMVNLMELEEGNSEKKMEKKKTALSMGELLTVLLPYFWPSGDMKGAYLNRIRSTSTWMMVGASKVCNICAPFFISDAANYLVAGDFYHALISMGLFSLLKLAGSVFKEMQSMIYIRVKQQASIELQELTFTHLHNLSLNWHLSKRTGSVMKSMDRGIEAANQLVSYLFLFLIPTVIECLSVIILFFVQYKQWQLGAVVFFGVAVYAILTVGITQWRKKFREQTNKHDNDFHDKATDSIINFETVKYFNGERFEIDRFKNSVSNYQKSKSSTQFSLSILNISQQMVLTVTRFGAMVVAGRAVVQGNMSLGGWIAVQAWVANVFAPLNFLGSVYNSIFQAFIDIRNLSELLSVSPDIVDSPDATDLDLTPNPPNKNKPNISVRSPLHTTRSGASVEFKNVFFHYQEQPEEKGLKNVSFVVSPGTTTAVVGHTGAGKTTISRLLFRFYDPKSGFVLINGQDIKKKTQKSVRQAIGIVPQDTVLFNDTIRHNISYGNFDASFDEIVKAAEAAQIRPFIESLPEKWDTVVGERGLKLSGGEKQRVAIARCLLKNPPIVLLDEATSALDTITENSIQEALLALGSQRTVLIIAHRLSTVKHADQIIVMDRGRVAELGTHEALLEKPDSIYNHMWQMQTSGNSSSNLHGIDSTESSKSLGLEYASSDSIKVKV